MNTNTRIISVIIAIAAIIIIIFASIRVYSPTPGQTATSTANSVDILVYRNDTEGFSLRYPADFTADESYLYQALGPGKEIGGVKFTIPTSTAAGTNLSSDSYFSVEEIPQAKNCSANLFLDQGAAAYLITDPVDSMTYSVASTTGAGAGNRYEETVYALPGTNPCVAVRYFIHYGVIENYPAGTITQFDKQTLLNQFDAMRRKLAVNQ